jgi:hypothetical protein
MRHPSLFGERLLLGYTLTQVNAARAKAGASQVVIPGRNAAPTMTYSREAGSSVDDPGKLSGPTAGMTEGGSYVAPTSSRGADAAAQQQTDAYRKTLETNQAPVQEDILNRARAKLSEYDTMLSNEELSDDERNRLTIERDQVAGTLSAREGAAARLRTSDPISATAPRTSGDLRKHAEARREERLRGKSLDPNNPVRKLLDQGAKYVGWSSDKGAAFNMPDGTRVYSTDFNETATNEFVKLYGESTVEAEEAAIRGEEGEVQKKDEAKHDKAITQSGIQASRESAVMDLFKGGITSPAQIANLLNFDEEGKQIGDFTMAEVQGIVNGQQPQQGSTMAALMSFIQGSTPEFASFMQQAMGQYSQRIGQAEQDYGDDVSMADREFAEFNTVVTEMMERRKAFMGTQLQLAREDRDQEEALAQITKEKQLAENQTEREMQQLKGNQQKRDIEKANRKRFERLGNRVAVAGGFGSGALLDQMDEVEAEGERVVSEFVSQMMLVDKSYSDRALAIEQGYTSTMVQISRNYSDKVYDLIGKYNDKADEVGMLLIGAGQRKYDAYKSARNSFRAEYNALNDKTLGLMKEGVNEALSRQDKLEAQIRQDKKDAWDDAMQYVDRYGTADKTYLNSIEQKLGLPQGSLSSMTLEERRMLKSSAGVGSATGGAMTWLQENYAKVAQQNPNDSPEEIAMKVAHLADQRFTGTSKVNVNAKNSIFETIGQELGITITSAGVKKDIARYNAQSTLRTRIMESDDPEGEMNDVLDELTTGTKAPFKGKKDEAAQFVVGLFEGQSVIGTPRPGVEPVSDFWHVGSINPLRLAPGFTNDNFTYTPR